MSESIGTPIIRLILVYNADSGLLNAMADSARKLWGGGECTLCSLTHGLAGERKGWRKSREELGVRVDHVHRDELRDPLATAVGRQIPSVVAETAEGLVVLLSPSELALCRGKTERLEASLRQQAEAAGLLLL